MQHSPSEWKQKPFVEGICKRVFVTSGVNNTATQVCKERLHGTYARVPIQKKRCIIFESKRSAVFALRYAQLEQIKVNAPCMINQSVVQTMPHIRSVWSISI